MKALAILLLFCSLLRLDAALTVTSKGGSQNTTNNTTLAVVPNATVAVGSLGLIVLAFKNSGTNGSTKNFTQATFSDSVGNTWTRRLDAIYDPGPASAGVELAAYTAPILTQITTSDNVTFTVGASTNAKTGAAYQIDGANGTPTYVTSAPVSDLLTSGQTSTAVSVTSSSITTGDAILAWSGILSITAPSASDTDTTNGSWSTISGTTNAAPIRVDRQYKIVTGTGTQTWDITLAASVAWEAAWIQLREAPALSNGFFRWP